MQAMVLTVFLSMEIMYLYLNVLLLNCTSTQDLEIKKDMPLLMHVTLIL